MTTNAELGFVKAIIEANAPRIWAEAEFALKDQTKVVEAAGVTTILITCVIGKDEKTGHVGPLDVSVCSHIKVKPHMMKTILRMAQQQDYRSAEYSVRVDDETGKGTVMRDG